MEGTKLFPDDIFLVMGFWIAWIKGLVCCRLQFYILLGDGNAMAKYACGIGKQDFVFRRLLVVVDQAVWCYGFGKQDF
jgi:hypothetical protein